MISKVDNKQISAQFKGFGHSRLKQKSMLRLLEKNEFF